MNSKYAQRRMPGYPPGTSPPKPVVPPVPATPVPATPVPAAPEGSNVPFGPPPPPASTRMTSGLASPSVPAVKEMQDAILKLAEVAANTASFGDFALQHFPLSESITNPSGQRNAAPLNLSQLIENLKNVGSKNIRGEIVTDGLWQTKTNNALHVIAEITSSMLKFTNSIGAKLGYTNAYLEAFKKLIPAQYTDLKNTDQIISTAKSITDQLHMIINYFTQINAKLVNNKTVQNYLSSGKYFITHQKAVSLPSDAANTKLLVGKIWGSKNPLDYISLQELSSLAEFKKFIKRIEPDINLDDPKNTNAIKEWLAIIEKRLVATSQPQQQ